MSRGTRRRRLDDRGMVTAETAVVLPVLVIVLAVAVWLVGCLSAQLRCVDSARAAARLAARGEAVGVVEAAGRVGAPAGARVVVGADADQVTVVVSTEVRPFGGLVGLLPGLTVEGRAAALREESLP